MYNEIFADGVMLWLSKPVCDCLKIRWWEKQWWLAVATPILLLLQTRDVEYFRRPSVRQTIVWKRTTSTFAIDWLDPGRLTNNELLLKTPLYNQFSLTGFFYTSKNQRTIILQRLVIFRGKLPNNSNCANNQSPTTTAGFLRIFPEEISGWSVEKSYFRLLLVKNSYVVAMQAQNASIQQIVPAICK